MGLRDSNKFKNKTVKSSFQHAFMGIKDVFQTERNFKSHLFSAFLVVICGCFLKLNLLQWCLIIFSIAQVLVAEIFNTAIERVVDLSSHNKLNPIAKQAKDIAAAGVLVSSIFSALIGLIVFGFAIIKYLK